VIVILAWTACVIGAVLGAYGCVLLAFDRSSVRAAPTAHLATPSAADAAGSDELAGGPSAVTAPTTIRPSTAAWAMLVGGAARDALTLLRRLASGVDATSREALADALDEVAGRFTALADVTPGDVTADHVTPDDVVEHLRVAAHGSRLEAERLRDRPVVGSDRRGYLDALRALRAYPARFAASSGPARTEATAATPDESGASEAAPAEPADDSTHSFTGA
jgi:hypothetical protein